MIRRALVTMVAVSMLFGFVAGCEWTGSGSDGTWSDQYNWVNFSGVYKPISGGILVQSHAYAAATAAGTNSVATVRRRVTETIGTGTGGSRSFSSTLGHAPVASGSIFVTDGFEAFQDVPTPGTLAGDKGGTGSINYNTGAISVTFNLDPGAGIAIQCTYEYDEALGSGSGSSSSSSSSSPQGSSLAVYSLSVFQQGNLLEMTDNNGALYKGKMGSLASSGGANQGQVADGSTVTAQFSANGISANGRGIKIVGTLQGRYQAGTSSGSSGSSSGTATSWLLTSRTMQATWIEDGGQFTGDITAVAPTAPVTAIASTNSVGL